MTYSKRLMKDSKDLIKIGLLGNVGGAAISGMANISGMPQQANVAGQFAMQGVNLASLGKLAETGMHMAGYNKISSPVSRVRNRMRINRIL